MIATLKSLKLERPGPRVCAFVVAMIVAQVACAQAPTTQPTTASDPAQTDQSKVEAYPLNAATRDVLLQWQQLAAGRSDIRVAIDDRTAQALVFAPPAIQAQIQQQLAAKTAAPAAPAAAPAAPNAGLNNPGGTVLFQLRQLPAAEVRG